MAERVGTVVRIGDRRVHRFQVVSERREDGSTREWIVVALDDDVVHLATPDFEWTKSVPHSAFRSGQFEPVVAGAVPVWGY